MPVVQISSFPASDAAPEVFKAPADVIKSAEGYKSSFYGMQLEDKKTAYFISVWESHEHYQKFLKDPAAAGIVENAKTAVAGKLERDHINVSSDPTPALTSPVVAITALTLTADGTAEKLTPLLQELEKSVEGTTGARAYVWGQSIENKNKYLLVVGWDSLEAHATHVQGGAQTEITKQMLAITTATHGHAALTKHV